MSTCISRHGEYGSHTLDAEHTCTRCGVLDEDALVDELRGLRQELDEARAERDAAINRYDNLIMSAGRARPRQPDGTCAECGALTGHKLECREFAAGVLDHARSIVRGDLSAVEAERDRMRPVVEAAEAYRVLLPDDPTDLPPETRGHRLAAAVDAFRSPTPDAEPAPGVPVDTEATP